MVGRKTANKCATCRKRKIKCGQQSPSCLQCVKGGWPCRYEDSVFHAYDTSSTDGSDNSSSKGGSPSSIAITRIHTPHRPRAVSMNAVESLRNELIFKINFNTVAARLMVMSTSQVLKQIPMRVGHSRALDDAVACICSSPPPSDESASASPNKAYSNALVSLQQAVRNDTTATATETLAAATLLQMYEHSVDHDRLGWIAHADGVIQMLQLRGPSRINNELELAILRTEVGNISVNALRNGTPCFLAEPEWHKILFSDDQSEKGKPGAAYAAIIDVGAFMPGVIAQYRCWKRDSILAHHDDNQQKQHTKYKLVAELRRVRQRAIEWQNLYDTDTLTQTEARNLPMRYSARAAFNVFHMLLLFMLLSIANEATKSTTEIELRPFVVAEETSLILHAARFLELASNVRTAIGKAVESDHLAAANTSSLMSRMIELVVTASQGEDRLTRIRKIMEDLLRDLHYARRPIGEYSRWIDQC